VSRDLHISAQEQVRELKLGLKEAEWASLYSTKQKWSCYLI